MTLTLDRFFIGLFFPLFLFVLGIIIGLIVKHNLVIVKFGVFL